MSPFDFLAICFVGVAALNLFLIRKRGWRAVGLAIAAAICAAAAYQWERDTSDLSKWLLAGAGGVFLAVVFYESAKRKLDPK
jgi:hypothetical protein